METMSRSSIDAPSVPSPGEQEMRAHLNHVLMSPVFERCPRMRRFLRYLCEEMFAGRGSLLKEYNIGLAVFDKPQDFDPATSATVRVEAGRLRRLLASYQINHGQADTISIVIPKGGYVPSFERKAEQGAALADREDDSVVNAVTANALSHMEFSRVTALSCSFRLKGISQLTAEFLEEFSRFRAYFSSTVAQLGGVVESSATVRLTVYFGWPASLEDTSGRAMTAATQIMAYARNEYGDNCDIRIGIDTGQVLSRPCLDQPLILGEVPAISMQMIGHAQSNTIVVSEETRRHARTIFEAIPAGAILAENGQQIPLWCLLSPRFTTSFLAKKDAASADIIGRGAELDLLCNRWLLASTGEGQSVLVEGEAGIGKSCLSEALIKGLRPKGYQIRLQCSAHHNNSALYPVIQFLRQWLGGADPSNATLNRFLDKVGLAEPVNRAVLQMLLAQADLEEDAAPAFSSASEKKEKMLQLLIAILSALCQRKPVVLLVEDLHWADPTTLELIGYAASACQDLRLYLIMTGRSGCSALLGPGQAATVLRLNRLSHQDCSRMIDGIAGDAALPALARDAIIGKADGVPLYLEELTKLMLAGGDLSTVPDGLNDLLASQLGCMGFARRVAQVVSIIGRDFPAEMLKALFSDEESRAADAVEQLLAAGILTRSRPNGKGRYAFRHALLRDAVYTSMMDADRKDLHSRAADILIDCFPEIAADHPEVIAGHMRQAGRLEEAVSFWLDGGRRAAQRYALAEAGANYRAAIDALGLIAPSRRRSERELDALLELGTTIREAEGYYAPGLKEVYERARMLAEEVGQPEALAASLHGIWTVAAGQGKWRHADLLALEFNQFIHSLEPNARLEAEGGRLLGAGAAFRGDFAEARTHFERVIAIYDPARHGRSFGYDPGVASAAYLSWVHWHSGNSEQGRREAEHALAMAEALGHPPTLSLVLVWLLFHAVCERDYGRIKSYNDRLQELCSQQLCRFWQPFGRACLSWASFHLTRDPAHLDELLAHTRAFSERYLTSCLHLLAADICDEMGYYEKGLHHTGLAATFMAEHDERIWEAEYWRLTGQLHARWGQNISKAQHCLEQALAIARQQKAVMLEQRAFADLRALPDSDISLVA